MLNLILDKQTNYSKTSTKGAADTQATLRNEHDSLGLDKYLPITEEG